VLLASLSHNPAGPQLVLSAAWPRSRDRPSKGGLAIKRLPLLLAVLILALVTGSTLPATAGPGDRPPDVPEPLQVPAGQQLVWEVVGKGVQIYDCAPSPGAPSTTVWTFREPAAVLYDHGRHPAGIHFRGPTFESFDGSSVLAALQASVPAPRLGAIPWLLLRAVSNQGDGVLGAIDWIQRLETKGGVAPPGPCDPSAATTLSVPYQAHYLFYSDAA
jgi:hypothetical protein